MLLPAILRCVRDAAQNHADGVSDDPGRKVGCAIIDCYGDIIAMGANTFPAGVTGTLERPLKYVYMEHAERNCLYECCRTGKKTGGGTAVLTLFCCAECARGLIQAGIEAVAAPKPDMEDPTWGASWKQALDMLHEARVETAWI